MGLHSSWEHRPVARAAKGEGRVRPFDFAVFAQGYPDSVVNGWFLLDKIYDELLHGFKRMHPLVLMLQP